MLIFGTDRCWWASSHFKRLPPSLIRSWFPFISSPYFSTFLQYILAIIQTELYVEINLKMVENNFGHEKDVQLDILRERRKDGRTSMATGSSTANEEGDKELNRADVEANSVASPSASGASTPSEDAQAGVKNIEAVAVTWTAWSLAIAYARFVFLTLELGLCPDSPQYLPHGLHSFIRRPGCSVIIGVCNKFLQITFPDLDCLCRSRSCQWYASDSPHTIYTADDKQLSSNLQWPK